MTTTTQEHAATPHKPQHHGQLEPIEPPLRESRPVLPMILRGSGLTLNLPYDEALERYGLWQVKITKNYPRAWETSTAWRHCEANRRRSAAACGLWNGEY